MPNFIPYIYLFFAIICEVVGTLLLPISQNFTKLIPTISLSLAYIFAFYFLTFSIKYIPLTIVYSTWTGIGIFLISILSYFIYNQALGWQTIIGLILIVIGVTIINTFESKIIYQ